MTATFCLVFQRKADLGWRRPGTLQAVAVAAALLKWNPLPCRPEKEGSQSCLPTQTLLPASLTAILQVLCSADQRQADLKLLEAPPDAAAGKTTRLIPNAKDADDEDDDDDSADESDDDEVGAWIFCCESRLGISACKGTQACCRAPACRMAAVCVASKWPT